MKLHVVRFCVPKVHHRLLFSPLGFCCASIRSAGALARTIAEMCINAGLQRYLKVFIQPKMRVVIAEF